MKQAFLSRLEKRITGFLLSHPERLPKAWRKAAAWFYPNAFVRKRYLEFFGVHMGEGTLANVCLIPVPGETAQAYIGNHVSIAPNVTLVLQSDPNNGEHLKDYRYVSRKLMAEGDIFIKDEAWIGANVTILPGITVGECAVIGAGCVLTEDADSYGIYAGVPGRKIGDIRQWGADCEHE